MPGSISPPARYRRGGDAPGDPDRRGDGVRRGDDAARRAGPRLLSEPVPSEPGGQPTSTRPTTQTRIPLTATGSTTTVSAAGLRRSAGNRSKSACSAAIRMPVARPRRPPTSPSMSIMTAPTAAPATTAEPVVTAAPSQLPIVVALAVLLAFVNELARQDG